MANAKAATTSGKKANPALSKPLQPSAELAGVVGANPLSRPDVVSKMWEYIKANNLQNPQNKREFLVTRNWSHLRREEGHHVRDEHASRPHLS